MYRRTTVEWNQHNHHYCDCADRTKHTQEKLAKAKARGVLCPWRTRMVANLLGAILRGILDIVSDGCQTLTGEDLDKVFEIGCEKPPKDVEDSQGCA